MSQLVSGGHCAGSGRTTRPHLLTHLATLFLWVLCFVLFKDLPLSITL